ncbi:MAG TPA: ABC transporter substrate-binding protein [Acidimicrobiia bacterium]|jgi:branched-chain amino acid transport system substrate-binding protein|nr:ABC transporter substrate-binding protein [Acidimicrobiia bacterium]
MLSARKIRTSTATLAVLALVLTACGGDAGTDTTATSGGGNGGTAGAELDVDAILASAGGDCEEPTGDPLHIGYAADLSEVGGYADAPGSEAARFMAELINCAGGVGGVPVQVTVQDIQGNPEVTQRAAQDLLEAGVHAILGPPFSDFGLPLLTAVNQQVPVIFVASTEEVLSDASIGAFLTAFDDKAQATAAAQFALDQGWETAVTFSSPDAPYFEQNPRLFGEVFEAGGGEVLADYTYSLGDEDYSTQVNQLAGLAEPPDVIYTSNIMPFVGTLIGQIRGAGIESEILGADSFDATGVIEAGDIADGVYYTTHGFPSDGSRMQAFLDAYEEARGEPLETISFGTLAADAVLIVANAYAEAGSFEAQALIDAIASAEDLDLVTETVTFAGTNGTPVKPVFIHQIQDGAPTLAGTLTPDQG